MSRWTDFNSWCDRNPKLSFTVFVLPVLIILCLAFFGCSSNSDRQTKTVERITTHTAAITVDLPVGQAVVQPTQVTVNREVYEVEQARTTIDAPSIGPILQAAASSTPFGSLIAGVLGFGGVAGAIHQMISRKRVERQRDEIIDGVEEAKGEIPIEHRETLLHHLAVAQSADTKKAVTERTA